MNSVFFHTFPTVLTELPGDLDPALFSGNPLGRGSKKEPDRDTLSVAQLSWNDKKGTHSTLCVMRKGWTPSDKSIRVTPVTDNLADVARTLNERIGIAFSINKLHSGLIAAYETEAIQFATDVQELIKKRNKTIENSSWIAFLDVVLKILTLGLFQYKESLKAPSLHLGHWQNTFNPDQEFTFTFQRIKGALFSIDKEEAAQRFFALPSSLPTEDKAFTETFTQHLIPQKRDKPLPLPNPEGVDALLSAAERSLGKVAIKAPDGSLKAHMHHSDGDLDVLDALFNYNFVSSGIILLKNEREEEIARIAIRKTAGEEFALLTLRDQTWGYAVSSPLNSMQALPESCRDFASASLIPIGPLDLQLAPEIASLANQIEPDPRHPGFWREII